MPNINKKSIRITTRYSPVPFVVGLGIFVVGIMVYSTLMSTNMILRYQPLADAAMEIKLEAAIGHLWFEEVISGDGHEDADIAMKPIDESIWYAKAMLEGGKNHEGVFVPLDDPMLRHEIEDVLEKVKEFRDIAEQRWESVGESGIGSDIEQRFDAVFNEFLQVADNVETELQVAMAKALQKFRAIQALLIVFCIGLFTYVAITFWRYKQKQLVDTTSLYESEGRLRAIIDNTSAVIYLKDINCKYTLVNRRYENLFNTSNKDVLGKSDFDIFPTNIADAFIKNDQEVIDRKGSFAFEETMPHNDELHTYISVKFPLLDEDRNVIGVCGISTDITDRKKIESELENTMGMLSNVLNSTPDMIFVKDTELRTVMCNKSFAAAVGKEPGDLLGKTDIENGWDPELVHGNPDKEVSGFENDDRKVLSGRAIHNPADLANVGDEVRIFDTKKIPLLDSDGNIIGVLGISRDVTEHKQMEEVLLQSEKLKSLGTITAGISHEFNNILSIISGKVQLLQMGYKNNSELMDSFRIIKQSINDGAEITGRMLDFTKTVDISDELVPTDLIELVNQALEFTMPRWKTEAQAKGINYHIDKNGMNTLPAILSNPSELREVFVNIINNALDAMADGGMITVKTCVIQRSEPGVRRAEGKESELKTQRSGLNGDFVEISISDTGKGMTEEIQKSIFDPFFTTRRPMGTGLGLSVAYSIIKRHSGNIDVASEVGKGSTFTIQLLASTKMASPTVSHEMKHETVGNGSSILVVDDEKITCDILDEFLSKRGYIVKTTNSGTGAIELIKSEPFDLVLCDHVMPNVTGCDVAKFIAGLEKRPRVGVITGWREIDKYLYEECVKVDFVLKKPFDFSVLTKHINDVIGEDSK